MFLAWKSGEDLATIAHQNKVSQATVEVYVIDCIAQRQGDVDLCRRLLVELNIDKEKFDLVAGHLTTRDISLRQIRDVTTTRYNEIRAIIAAIINGVFL